MGDKAMLLVDKFHYILYTFQNFFTYLHDSVMILIFSDLPSTIMFHQWNNYILSRAICSSKFFWTGVHYGGNPCQHGKNMQTPQRKASEITHLESDSPEDMFPSASRTSSALGRDQTQGLLAVRQWCQPQCHHATHHSQDMDTRLDKLKINRQIKYTE